MKSRKRDFRRYVLSMKEGYAHFPSINEMKKLGLDVIEYKNGEALVYGYYGKIEELVDSYDLNVGLLPGNVIVYGKTSVYAKASNQKNNKNHSKK